MLVFYWFALHLLFLTKMLPLLNQEIADTGSLVRIGTVCWLFKFETLTL